jgi:hypothetical protein
MRAKAHGGRFVPGQKRAVTSPGGLAWASTTTTIEPRSTTPQSPALTPSWGSPAPGQYRTNHAEGRYTHRPPANGGLHNSGAATVQETYYPPPQAPTQAYIQEAQV